jgi:hypothetical protein
MPVTGPEHPRDSGSTVHRVQERVPHALFRAVALSRKSGLKQKAALRMADKKMRLRAVLGSNALLHGIARIPQELKMGDDELIVLIGGCGREHAG